MTIKNVKFKKVRCPCCGTRYLTSPDHPESCPSCSLPHSVGEVRIEDVVKGAKKAVYYLLIIICSMLYFGAAFTVFLIFLIA